MLSIAVKYIGGNPGRSVSNLFLVLNMKVQRKVTPREVNSDRAMGLMEDGMSQEVVARHCNVSRKPVSRAEERKFSARVDKLLKLSQCIARQLFEVMFKTY